MIQKELNTGFAATHKIIHEEIHMKYIVYHWVLHNLTKHQKEEHVGISKETRKFLNDGSHHIIFKIVMSDEMYIQLFDLPIHQESKVWIFE